MMFWIHIFMCIVWSLSGCSLFRGEVDPRGSMSGQSGQNQPLDERVPLPSYSQSPGLSLSTCTAADCEPWTLHTPAKFELCLTPLAVYQQIRPLSHTDHAEGSEVRWAIFTSSVKKPLAPPTSDPAQLPDTTQNRWRLIWEGVISSEMLGAHTESVYTRTTITPQTKQKLSIDQPCRNFIARRQQSARSFHLVDARESEFDEDDIEELRFNFDLERGIYVHAQEKGQPKIKVRTH